MTSVQLGKQLLIEYYACDPNKLKDLKTLRALFLDAAKKSSATIINDLFHAFQPQGASGVILIAESHIAMHTWPEHRIVAVDVFSCSDKMDLFRFREEIKNGLNAETMVFKEIERGKRFKQ